MIRTISHIARYFADGDTYMIYRRTGVVAVQLDWVRAGEIAHDGVLSHACAALIGTLSDESLYDEAAMQPGRIVHQFRIRRGGKTVYSNELYPSMRSDTAACGVAVREGDTVEVRGFTASLTVAFVVGLVLTIADD